MLHGSYFMLAVRSHLALLCASSKKFVEIDLT